MILRGGLGQSSLELFFISSYSCLHTVLTVIDNCVGLFWLCFKLLERIYHLPIILCATSACTDI